MVHLGVKEKDGHRWKKMRHWKGDCAAKGMQRVVKDEEYMGGKHR